MRRKSQCSPVVLFGMGEVQAQAPWVHSGDWSSVWLRFHAAVTTGLWQGKGTRNGKSTLEL